MIRVGLNTAIRTRGISGSARIVEHLAAALDNDPEVIAFTVQPRWRERRSKHRNAAQDCYWDMWRGARTNPRADVFLSPCNVGRTPASVPHLLWIHDTVVLDHPEWHDPSYAAYARAFFGVSVRSCTRIVTGTADSAERIRRRWPKAPTIEILPWPVSGPVAKGPRTEAPEPPYSVLMVAATEAHKNHPTAIDAVRQARLFSGQDIRLTLVGPPGREEEVVREYVRTADPEGRWLERRESVSRSELHGLYSTSSLLIHPAFDEGFGLPLLEAAARGMPVIHSGRGGMPEVVPSPLQSVAADAFAEQIVRVLGRDAYAAASRTALEAAQAHSVTRFESGLAALIRGFGA